MRYVGEGIDEEEDFDIKILTPTVLGSTEA